MTTRTHPLRRSLAAAAARLIAEEGVEDYAFAKRKAARQLGLNEAAEGVGWPSNAEVDEALAAHMALFQDDDHAERIEALRYAAVLTMRALAPLKPYLTGAVLAGTAGAFSSVELEVFADSAKDVEIFLLGLGVRYEHRDIRRHAPDAPEAVLEFDYDEAPIRLSVFNHLAQRSARRAAPGGTSERMNLAALEAMLKEQVQDAAA